jgi:hypothetical protein
MLVLIRCHMWKLAHEAQFPLFIDQLSIYSHKARSLVGPPVPLLVHNKLPHTSIIPPLSLKPLVTPSTPTTKSSPSPSPPTKYFPITKPPLVAKAPSFLDLFAYFPPL